MNILKIFSTSIIFISFSSFANNNKAHQNAERVETNKMIDSASKFLGIDVIKKKKRDHIHFKGKIFYLHNGQELPLKAKRILILKNERVVSTIQSDLSGVFQVYQPIAVGSYTLKHESENYACTKSITLKSKHNEFIHFSCPK